MAKHRATPSKPAALKREEAAARSQRALLARYLGEAGAAKERALVCQIVHAWGGVAAEGGRRAAQRRLNVVSYRIAQFLARGSALRRLFNFWVSTTDARGVPEEHVELAGVAPCAPPPGLGAPPVSCWLEARRASSPFQ